MSPEKTNVVARREAPGLSAEQVCARIRAAILQGDLKPGAKLTEQDLAAEYEVSRTPVREAIRQLEVERLVTRTPFVGVAVRQLTPDAKETRVLSKAVRLPLFSWVGLPASIYEDSDDIEIRSVGVEANLRVSDQWRLLADAARREHSAPVTGPFAPVGGGDAIDERRVGVGAHLALTPDSALEFWAGRSELDHANGRDAGDTIGRLVWSHRASDRLAYRVHADRDRVAASPRSVSLGVLRNRIGVDMDWRPTLRDSVRLDLAFDDLNDDNRRHWLQADYRRALHRSDRAIVDVGGQVEWMGYSRDPGNGYYSPDRYVRVAPLLSTYLQLGEEAGLHLQPDAAIPGHEHLAERGATEAQRPHQREQYLRGGTDEQHVDGRGHERGQHLRGHHFRVGNRQRLPEQDAAVLALGHQ